jgi:hypothetical protein
MSFNLFDPNDQYFIDFLHRFIEDVFVNSKKFTTSRSYFSEILDFIKSPVFNVVSQINRKNSSLFDNNTLPNEILKEIHLISDKGYDSLEVYNTHQTKPDFIKILESFVV